MKVFEFLRLIRVVNSLMIGMAVIIGSLIAKGWLIDLELLIIGFFVGFFISSYSMVINDYFDLEVDRINAPNRPLVKGVVSIKEALIFSIVLLTAGLSLSMITGLFTFLVAVMFSFFSFLYNWRFKEYGFIGNLLVGASISIPFIYGALLVSRISLLVISMSMTAFFAGVGREVIKGMADIEGDRLRNVRTIARSKGLRNAGCVGAMFFILAILSSLIPIFMANVGMPYMVIIGMTDIFFIYLAIKIVRNPMSYVALNVKRKALMGMLLGLIGYLLEGLVGG